MRHLVAIRRSQNCSAGKATGRDPSITCTLETSPLGAEPVSGVRPISSASSSSDPNAQPSAHFQYATHSYLSASCPFASDSARSGQSGPSKREPGDSSHCAIPNGWSPYLTQPTGPVGLDLSILDTFLAIDDFRKPLALESSGNCVHLYFRLRYLILERRLGRHGRRRAG